MASAGPSATATAVALDRSTMSRRWLLVIFLLAFLLRAGWGLYRCNRAGDDGILEFPDERQYWVIAESLWKQGRMRDELGFHASRMPLYPGLLAPFTSLPSGARWAVAAQWVVGSMIPIVIALLAARIARPVGVIAGLLVAVDPFLVFFSSLLLTETLFMLALAMLLLGAVALRDKPGWLRAALVGASAVFVVYAREAGLGLVMLLAILILVDRRFSPKMAIMLGLIPLFLLIGLWPWATRNQRLLGERVWLTTRGGISLYDGVGPAADGSSDLADVQTAPEVAGLDELSWDRHFRDAAWKSIRSDPWRVLRLAATKIGRMWNPIPNVGAYRSTMMRVVSAGWMLPVLGFAVVGAIRLTKRKGADGAFLALILFLPALYLTALHALFVGSVRYRLPAMPFLEVAAAVGVWGVATWLTNRRIDNN